MRRVTHESGNVGLMDATYQTLAAAAELGEFTVAVLAGRAGVKATTVRTVLNRNKHLFEVTVAGSGRRGGQPQVWRVKESAKTELNAIVGGIATRFDEDQRRLLPDDEVPLAAGAGRLRLPATNPELATAEDLQALAPHIGARELLPQLVRRLLAATPGLTALSMRAGDGIDLPGYDGRAETTISSPFVPEGRSVWELGTSHDPRAKAQHDYRRRSQHPSDIDPAITTYVAVSMRRFPGKDVWAARCRAEHIWRDVRVLDVDDLAAWLKETPTVHIWASEQLGLRPLDVSGLGWWWDSWLAQTEPPTPGELLLAGRRHTARELRRVLKAEGQVVGVYASSREEATAFSAAALLTSDQEDGYFADVDPLSTAVFVHARQAWERLAMSRLRSVLIPLFDDADVAAAIRNGHRMVVPMGPSDDRSRARIDVPLIDREEAREVFRRSFPSLSFDEADRRAAHARRSLLSFRRAFAVNPARRGPAWAERPAADTLAPLVLVGSWHAESAADQAVVAGAVGRPYPDIERELLHPADPDDPPFIRAGNRWQLTSPADGWTLLRSLLTEADLERWYSEAIRVLTEEDPVGDLPPGDRLLAPARGVRRAYSSALRSGLARGAALLASNDADRAPDGRPWEAHAADLVAELLGTSTDPRRWTALEDVLPALAEAAPEIILQALTRGLAGTTPPLRALFTDAQQEVWETRSPHTGLLWALELLCWADEHVAEACDVLARLAEIDPGGRLANRPAASLRRVLLPWYPQTAASLDDRMEIVTGIVERRPRVGWPLLLGLLPQHFDSSHPNYHPMFRDWKSQATEASPWERIEAAHRLVNAALAHLYRAPEAWADFCEVLPNLAPNEMSRSLTALGEVDLDSIAGEARLSTWQALTTVIALHRQSPTAVWALPDAVLTRFETVTARWEPHESPERHARLFDWHPDLPDTDKLDHAAYDAQLTEARRAVVAPILDIHGVEVLNRLIGEAPVPRLLGATVADVAGDTVADAMLASLGRAVPKRLAAVGWVVRMSDLAGPEWVAAMRRRAAQLPDDSRVHLYLALPNEPATWDAVDHDTHKVADRFWQALAPTSVGAEHALELVERLLDHRRPWSAVDLLAHHSRRSGADIPVDLLDRTLRAATAPDVEEPHPPGPIDYDLGVLLDQLESAGGSSDVVCELELLSLARLEHRRTPRALFRALTEHPDLFVRMVRDAFRTASEPANTRASGREVMRARQAFSVLRLWRQPPGLREDGTLDEQVLHDWVSTARRLLADADRIAIGDECIGQVLSGSPPGIDGIWPPEPIRRLLEELDSESFRQGLAVGRLNARGATFRGLFDGGRQEDALADQYETGAKKIMARSPQTGRLLRELAHSYRVWARREDAMSEEWAAE